MVFFRVLNEKKLDNKFKNWHKIFLIKEAT
jgi:hypothetical protein